MNEVAKLAVDLYKGNVTDYSNSQATDVLRKELIEANGGSEVITPKSFRNNPQLFEIIEEALDVLVVEGLEDQFDDFVEVSEIPLGDAKVYTVEDDSLFDVSVVSDGNGDIRRQRLDSGEFTIRTSTMAVAIYEELNRLLSGRVDWVKMVQNVARSYNNKIKEKIYQAIYDSYDQLNGTYKETGSFDVSTLNDLVAHVEAATGQEAVIFGTKGALSKVTPAVISDNMKDKKNELGYYGVVNGTNMIEIKQAHKAGTNEFAISDDFLIVAPQSPDRMVKVVYEGDSLITETTEGRKDLQRDYTFIKKAGVGVVSASKYGIYRLGN